MYDVFDNDYSAGQPAIVASNDSPVSSQRSQQQSDSATFLSFDNNGCPPGQPTTIAPRNPPKQGQRSRQQPGSACEEDLRTQLNGQQQEEHATISHPESSSHQTSASSNEDGSSEGGNEVRSAPLSISTDVTANFGDIQCWSAPLAPLETLEQSLAFASFEHQQVPAPCPTPAPDPIGLGVAVHLTPMICTDLDQLYFDRVHAFAPMLQKFRYLSWSKQPEKPKQRTCLQYAMWTLAASLSSQFQLIRLDLYAEARQLLESLESDSQGHQCLEQVQAWILLSIYELTSNTCNYQRGMISAGRAFRLVQLMRLNEIDGPSNVAVSSPGKRQGDWIDIESMRRTFWVAYTVDRFTSAIDGLLLTFNEHQIFTRLPASDVNFKSGRSTTMCFLDEGINEVDSEWLNDGSSSFTQSIIVATIWGRTLEHKQRSRVIRQPQQLSSHCQETEETFHLSDFLQRHQSLKDLLTRHLKILSTHVTSMSDHPDPMLIFVALTAYMTVLMLYDTIELRASGTDAQVIQVAAALLTDHKHWSLEAVHKLSMLTATLGQINHFQTHPFTPIPFLLSGRGCLRHLGMNDAYSNLIPGIASALEGLAAVNGLAQNCLRLLSFEHNDACKID